MKTIKINMKKKIYLPLLPLLAAVIFLPSCSARIEGTLKEDGSAEFTLQASLEKGMTALIRSLSALSGPAAASREAPLINGPAIGASMSAAPGIASVSLNNSGPAAIEGDIRVSRIDDFLKQPESWDGKQFITYTPSPGRLTLTLDRNAGPRIIALLSEEVTDYLSVLMAPVVTGERLSKGEYLDLVASIYGRAVADEIAASRIHARVDFPGPLRSVRGGTFSGRRAEFAVPLIDLLVLEVPLEYEVRW
jgi:hypothetical protein